MKKVFVCSDTTTGIFSAIYDAWKWTIVEGLGDSGIRLEENLDTELFCDYIRVKESEKKVVAVERMILENLGWYAYKIIYQAALSTDPMKGEAIYQTILTAREIPNSRQVLDHMSHPQVNKVVKLGQNVGMEAHQWTGFLRFRELDGGILYAQFEPKNRVLTCVAPHFAERLSVENWIIYDEKHEEFAVHEARKQWVLASGMEMNELKRLQVSEREKEVQNLWKEFRQTIAIKERKNPKCQIQHMPLWYRKNMVEFAEKC